MSRQVSTQYSFYSGQFPAGKSTKQDDPHRSCFVVDYDVMKQMFPERFNLTVLNGVFQAFLECNGESVIPLFSAVPDDLWDRKPNYWKTKHFYQYDQLKYKATVETTMPRCLGMNKCIAIRLSNDGYLYSKEDELSGKWDDQPAHRNNKWYYLDEAEQAKVSSLADFAKSRLPNDAEVQLRYLADAERVDFSIRDAQLNVLKINFEHGPPVDDFVDKWMAESTPDSWFVVARKPKNIAKAGTSKKRKGE